MNFWTAIWDAIWWMLTIFVFIAYLMALFSIISDLFRDRKLNGFAKAVWLLFLVFLPFITALVYLIFRGRGMAERAEAQAGEAQAATENYIRTVAGGPAGEIAQAKRLLDDGVITTDEFAQLKQTVLGQSRPAAGAHAAAAEAAAADPALSAPAAAAPAAPAAADPAPATPAAAPSTPTEAQ